MIPFIGDIAATLLADIGAVLGSKGSGTIADPVIATLAHTLYGPGYNSGAAPLVGDGTAKTYAANFVNLSGAAITVASIAFQGWNLRTTGTTDCSANYDVTGNIEYPVGTVVGSIAATVTPGGNLASPQVTLSAAVPTGATFRVSLTSTIANAATYIQNLGFAGLRTHAKQSTLKKVRLGGFGDSIMTNNNGALINAANTRCPAYLNSITGTQASTYGANSGAFFTRQRDLVALLGLTHVISNFSTNDVVAGVTLSALQGYITTMRDMIRSVGAKWVHCTMLPRTLTALTPETVSNVVSSGFTVTVNVADASKYSVGMAYIMAGATQTEYNGTKLCTARDTTANTVSFLFPGSATTPATGTITVVPWKVTMSAGHMPPLNTNFAAGSGSYRGQFNAWTRSGVFDAFIDWGDACEPSRDAGRWLVGGEDALLPAVQLITVSSVTSTSRFNSNYSRGSSTIPNGVVQPLTGANAGVLKGGSGNTNGDITVASAWTNAQAVNDQYYALPGTSYMSDDGTHPRVAGGAFGGQPHLDNATSAWIDLQLA